MPGQLIGAVDLYDDFTLVEIPSQYQEQVLAGMAKVTVRNRKATLRPATAQDIATHRARKRDAGATRRQSMRPSQQKRSLQKRKRVWGQMPPQVSVAKTI
jgi:hypothetical protein